MKDPLTRRGFIRNAAVGSATLTWLGAQHAPQAHAVQDVLEVVSERGDRLQAEHAGDAL